MLGGAHQRRRLYTKKTSIGWSPFPKLKVSSSLRLLPFSQLLMTTWRLLLHRLLALTEFEGEMRKQEVNLMTEME